MRVFLLGVYVREGREGGGDFFLTFNYLPYYDVARKKKMYFTKLQHVKNYFCLKKDLQQNLNILNSIFLLLLFMLKLASFTKKS